MFEKMRRIGLLVLLVSAFTGHAGAAPTPAPKCEYEYKPFPRLRSTPVQEDHFVQRLRDSCKALEQAPNLKKALEEAREEAGKLKTVPMCWADGEALAGIAPGALTEQIKLARQLPPAPDAPPAQEVAGDERTKRVKHEGWVKAPKAEGKPQEAAGTGPDKAAAQECANARASTDKVVAYVEDLRAVCGKLHRAAPKSIDETELEVLRTARDTQELLETIRLWKGGKFDGFRGFQEALAGSAGKAQSMASALAPGLGTLSDQLIRGMAEFLAKRAQDEALLYLREKLKNTLCGDQGVHADLRKAAFSYTCQAIEGMDESMSLQAVGSTMRAAAEKDLRKLPDLGLDYVEFTHPDKANLTFAARLGLAYFSAARGGQEPFGLLASLGELEFQTCESKNCVQVSNAARFASAVAYALRQGGSLWYSQYEEGFPPEDRPVAGVAVLLLTEQRLKGLGSPRDIAWRLTAALVNRVIVQTFDVVMSAGDVVKTWQVLEESLKRELTEQERRDLLAEGILESAEKVARLFETLGRFGYEEDLAKIRQAADYWTDFVEVAASLVRRDYARS